VAASAEAGSLQPDAGATELGAGRLRQFVAYARKVFGLDSLLARVRDRRKDPVVPTCLVVRILFLLGLLRIRSFNALEPKLGESSMLRALGITGAKARSCSVDTLAYCLSRTEVSTARDAVVQLTRQAERHKVFREGWHGTLRVVAIDGWEPISSFNRHCPACLTRQVRTVNNGVEKFVTQYYHSFVVAMLVDGRLDFVVDMEPIRSADVRADAGEANVRGHEGELTAGKRLVARLRATYGRWIDAVVVDALYANGPFLTTAKQAGLGVFVILQKETDEPLKEALALCEGKAADKIVDVDDEHIELWDCRDIETLSSYDGAIRVVRAHITRGPGADPSTWCIATTGCASRLSPEQVLSVGRGRWHIENTAFHQFTARWRFKHVFTHGPEAIPALFWIFLLAFNLLQLFLYRQLCSYGRDRGKDVTRTISRLIDEMNDDLARFNVVIAWDSS
jgi:hypothetical protein